MAAFDSPPPRKTHRYGAPRQPSTPPRQRKLVGTRLASGANNAPPTAKSTTPTNAMDVQEAGYYDRERPLREKETVFAKTEELVVGLYGNLPVEVRHVLRSADFLTESYVGGIDGTSGYTLVASVRTCYVWAHATLKPTSPSPTCYILPCPPPPIDHPTTTFQAPYFALVPSRARAVEPGLILVSPTGVARFWPSISSGLSGGGAFESVQIPLGVAEDEYVSRLTRIDQPAGAYAQENTPSRRREFSPQPSSSSLSLTRLFGIGWSAPTPAPRPEPGNVVTLVSSGSVIFALVETRIQKWALSSEELIRETDVGDVVREAIASGVGVEDLEGIDLVVESENTLVLLVSYASSGSLDAGAMVLDQYEYGPRRVYAIVRLVSHEDGWGVDRISVVPYVANAASPPAHPHLSLLAGGAIVAVLFGEVVVLCARDTPYHERLVLKSSTDRLLGLAALPSVFSVDYADADSSVDMDGGETREEAQMLLMASGLMLKARVDVDKVKRFRLESLPNLLKATLKQAILYSPIPSNPLQFILPPSPLLDGDALMHAAEETSASVLASDPEIVRPNHDLTAQLTARKERLSWLIGFINDNGALGKMSQRSRQRLATDAEKLYACHQLWVKLNEHIDSGAAHSLIVDTIHAFTATHPSSSATPSHPGSPSTPERTPSQDVVRDFFKHRLGSMGSGGIGPLKEIGGAVVTTLQAALSYRAYNLGVYGVDLPMIKPWTSRPTVIDAVLKLVDAASKVATDSGSSSSAGAKDVVNMLPELATLLFACVQERLDWLGSPMAADEPGTQRDRIELEDRFSQLRPEILETLRLTDHLQQALALATTYTDFSSLASLLLRPTPYPPSANPHASLINDYRERYNHAFGREVVRWCIEHGEARVLFAEEDVWGPYMDEVFADGVDKQRQRQESGAMDVDGRELDEFNAIAWVNDMGRSRFGDASRRLINVAKGATEVGQKHLMLSLGKLAQLAHLQEGGALDGALLEAFHDGLDFIAVQEKLFKDFQTGLASLRGKQKQNQDAQVEAIVRAKASKLKESERKGFISIFKNETTKRPWETTATALQLLLREGDLPDVRRLSAFRRVWCRVYNHDDWDAIRQTANITDAQLAARFRGTALYHTLQAILPVIKSTPQNETLPEGFDLDPNQCLPVPLMPETSSRFPGMPVEMVGELARDFRAESTKVERMKLDDVYFRVRELASEDLGYEEH
ncbi:hypothetical protein EDC04DRAFT_3031700 [Pisolithus marmoratus]|nr:hypothetical protein EDC04DRAFT_3031700 [Pisolithus marmoratus]